jgi:hypothetical protein
MIHKESIHRNCIFRALVRKFASWNVLGSESQLMPSHLALRVAVVVVKCRDVPQQWLKAM